MTGWTEPAWLASRIRVPPAGSRPRSRVPAQLVLVLTGTAPLPRSEVRARGLPPPWDAWWATPASAATALSCMERVEPGTRRGADVSLRRRRPRRRSGRGRRR